MQFNHTNKLLVVAVGGGNDSVSAFLLLNQLIKHHNLSPKHVDVLAMLPDCLEYSGLRETAHSNLFEITKSSTRSVQGITISAFPEQLLVANKDKLTFDTVYGVLMTAGSIGVSNALFNLVREQQYDTVLAVDVGGDFIADESNLSVLSPMMDGYMGYALHLLEHQSQAKVCYAVFGLGTDGESTPELLHKALRNVNAKEFSFDKEVEREFSPFYREHVEPFRYSRTMDFTLKEISEEAHDNPTPFRARFHVKQLNNQSSKHYGYFQHEQSEEFYGKYWLFESITPVNNRFKHACRNGVEWFLNVQSAQDKVNTELNGQMYKLSGIMPGWISQFDSLFFGTPSRLFCEEAQKRIAAEIEFAISNSIYDMAFVYTDYFNHSDLFQVAFENGLTLLSKYPLDRDLVFHLKNL